jgi:hypothetical protein
VVKVEQDLLEVASHIAMVEVVVEVAVVSSDIPLAHLILYPIVLVPVELLEVEVAKTMNHHQLQVDLQLKFLDILLVMVEVVLLAPGANMETKVNHLVVQEVVEEEVEEDLFQPHS